MVVLYFLIGLIATVFGALAGLGGGIIIKPVLDFMGDYDVETIGILSAATVFAMAGVSLLNSTKLDAKIDARTSFILAIGSVMGGLTGKLAFNHLVGLIPNSHIITVIQASMIAVLMCLIYIFVKNKGKMKTYYLRSPFIIVGIGLALGILAAFLGIGGGPFNVAILALCFSMTPKESALNSIFIIFFSQLSSLLFTTFTTGFQGFDLSMLPYIVTGGILGGWLGTRISKVVKDCHVEKIFMVGIVGIILLSLSNIVRYFM